jgi:hypothetical protein
VLVTAIKGQITRLAAPGWMQLSDSDVTRFLTTINKSRDLIFGMTRLSQLFVYDGCRSHICSMERNELPLTRLEGVTAM